MPECSCEVKKCYRLPATVRVVPVWAHVDPPRLKISEMLPTAVAAQWGRLAQRCRVGALAPGHFLSAAGQFTQLSCTVL